MTPADAAAHQRKVKGGAIEKPKPASKPSKDYETWLSNQLEASGLGKPAHQFRWLDDRQYRADLAYPPLLIEIDGAAHRIKGRFMDDILKNQEAIFNGFYLLRIATAQVRNGTAVGIVRRALERIRAYGPTFSREELVIDGTKVPF